MWFKNVALRKPTWIGGRNVGKNNKIIARSNLSAGLIINTSNLEALTLACLKNSAKTWFRHTSCSILHVCTLAIENKHTKPRFCDKGWNEVISRTESIRVVILHYFKDLVEKVLRIWLKVAQGLKLKGKVTDIIQLRNESASILFEVAKLTSWSNATNVALLEKLSSVIEKTEELAKNLKASIDHLQSLEMSSNIISLSSKRKKMHVYETCSLPLWL